MKKPYYFIIKKTINHNLPAIGNNTVIQYLYLDKKKKFKITHRANDASCFNWFKAHWYWMLWNLPYWLYKNAILFNYSHINGRIFLCKKSLKKRL